MYQTIRMYGDNIKLHFVTNYGEDVLVVNVIDHPSGATLATIELDKDLNKDLRHVLQQGNTARLKPNVVAPEPMVAVSKGLPPEAKTEKPIPQQGVDDSEQASEEIVEIDEHGNVHTVKDSKEEAQGDSQVGEVMITDAELEYDDD